MHSRFEIEFPVSSRAIVADGTGGFSLRNILVDAPGAGEVMVGIAAAGLCHTDWDMIHINSEPSVLGHEGAGVVLAIGSRVSNVSVGQRVVLNWAIPCRDCAPCSEGLYPLCELNSPANGDGISGHARPEATLCDGVPIRRSFNLGTMSEVTVVKAEAVVPICDDIPFDIAAIMGCGVMTGFGSVANVAKVPRGASVAVLGCGGIGLNVIQGARIAGARQIIAIDIAEDRLDRAARFGATDRILSERASLDLKPVIEQVRRLTVRGADFAFECTAVPELAAAPLALVRHGGTAIQVSGVEQTIEFDCRLFEWDKTYLNPLYGRCDPSRDFDVLQEHYRSGALELDALISHRYELGDIEQAFKDLLAGKLAKAVLLNRAGSTL